MIRGHLRCQGVNWDRATHWRAGKSAPGGGICKHLLSEVRTRKGAWVSRLKWSKGSEAAKIEEKVRTSISFLLLNNKSPQNRWLRKQHTFVYLIDSFRESGVQVWLHWVLSLGFSFSKAAFLLELCSHGCWQISEVACAWRTEVPNFSLPGPLSVTKGHQKFLAAWPSHRPSHHIASDFFKAGNSVSRPILLSQSFI